MCHSVASNKTTKADYLMLKGMYRSTEARLGNGYINETKWLFWWHGVIRYRSDADEDVNIV